MSFLIFLPYGVLDCSGWFLCDCGSAQFSLTLWNCSYLQPLWTDYSLLSACTVRSWVCPHKKKKKKKSALKCGQRHWRLCLHGLCSLSSLRVLVPVHSNTTNMPAASCFVRIWGWLWGWHTRTNNICSFGKSIDHFRTRKAYRYSKPQVISHLFSPALGAADS